MPDCFSKSEVTDFLNFMKLPDGTSVVSDDMMEYLTAYGFFMVLYTLHVHLGFGKKRLRKFYDAFSAEHDRLIQYYQMPDDYTWLCKEMLKRIGVDVEAWNKERKEPDETEKH